MGNDNNKVEYSVSSNLVSRLTQLNISFTFTSYQSGLLYFIGQNTQGGINVHQIAVKKPMGLYFNSKHKELVLASGYYIYRFKNTLEANQQINDTFDACFVPRILYLTGHLDAHDIGIDKNNQPLFINTRFNCLATISNKYSFKPVWKPPFISTLIDEDRCHLNGLAMHQGEAVYATAVSRSDTIDGWRDRRSNGGVVIDIKNNKIICQGLSMPHSPRVYNNELWILNAGTGELGIINQTDPKNIFFEARVFCPGFLRGLAFYQNFAFVGLSKPRYERFEGLALDQRLQETDSEPWCGIQIIDLTTRTCVDWFRIDGEVAELYDIAVIPETICPMGLTENSNEVTNLITFPQNT